MVQLIRQAAGTPLDASVKARKRVRGGVKMRQLSNPEHWFRLRAKSEKQKTNHMGE